MTLLYIDGFDDRTNTVGREDKPGWVNVSGGSLQSTNARLGTIHSLRCATDLWGGGVELFNIPGITLGNATTVIGYGMQPEITNDGTDANAILQLFGDSGATLHLTFIRKADDTIEVRRGTTSGTILGTTVALTWTPNVYHYFEFKVLIHDSAGTVHIHRDEIEILAETSLDTKNGGTNSYIDVVEMTGQNTFYYAVDDLYILDGAGSVNTDFLGDVHVETKFPNAEGTTQQWTPSSGSDNSALVDENPAPNDTDYNSDSTPGNFDELEVEDMDDNTNTIFGIQVMSWAQKSDAGPIKFRHRIDSGTVATYQDQDPGVGFTFFSDMVELDPNTSAQWTGANFDAAEFGYETRT